MKPDQQTIKKEITIEGIGVHSGHHSIITLTPAPTNSGIQLINKQFPSEPIYIGTTLPEQAMHATVLKSGSWAISTTEHLMAAIYGLGIDNLIIIIKGCEIPIMDGSAIPFVHAIQQAGIKKQNKPKQFVTPKKTLRFEDHDKFIELTPATQNFNLSFRYSVNFDHPLVQDTSINGCLSSQFFIQEIAPARTFGFLEQLPLLRKHGLAKGTTLGNTVVVGNENFLNSRRFDNEFIRHKLLDLIGDLALLGKSFIGTVTAHKTGHAFNRKIVEHFIQNPTEWKILREISQ